MALLAFQGKKILFELTNRKAAIMQALPCFTVGFDMLSCTEYSATVHTGAVVQRNTVSTVIFVLFIWAVTATLTVHCGTLEITPKENLLAQGNVLPSITIKGNLF